ESVHHRLTVDAGDQGLAHADVGEDVVADAQAPGVVHSLGLGGVQVHTGLAHTLLVLCGDGPGDAGLAGQQRPDSYGGLGGDFDLDLVHVGPALVARRFRCPVVVLARLERDRGADLLVLDHERPGADDAGGIPGAEVLIRPL